MSIKPSCNLNTACCLASAYVSLPSCCSKGYWDSIFNLDLSVLAKNRKIVYFWPGDAETPGGPSVKYEIVGHWSLECLLSLKFCSPLSRWKKVINGFIDPNTWESWEVVLSGFAVAIPRLVDYKETARDVGGTMQLDPHQQRTGAIEIISTFSKTLWALDFQSLGLSRLNFSHRSCARWTAMAYLI